MTTELERVLSSRLHREAAEMVPDAPATPVPTARIARGNPSPRRLGPRWRTPVLAAAAVLAVAVGTAAVIQIHHDQTIAPVAPSPVSPLLNAPAPSFSCGTGNTIHAATTDVAVIGVTSGLFCLDSAGTNLKPPGPLRAWLATDTVVAGAVDPSVDTVVWVSSDGARRVVVSLYTLGSLRGFAIEPDPAGSGTVLLYTDSAVVVQIDVPGGIDEAAPSSSPASEAETSYPPGQDTTPKPGAWPTNARGQTYGSSGDATAETGQPDLVLAYATNGKEGYVLRTDLESPMPTSISDAIAHNTAASRTIPVYKSDGITKIGEFVVGG